MTALRPVQPVSETLARVTVRESRIRVRFPEKLDPFNKLVKSLGYYWSRPYWMREPGPLAGSIEDRAAELCSRLLDAGYVVDPPDEQIERMVVSGSYLPECKRWILPHDNGWFRLWWARGLDYYARARQITGSRYDPSTYCVIVPPEQFAEVEDFATLHEFRFSLEARTLLAQARQNYDSMSVIIPTVHQDAGDWKRPVLVDADTTVPARFIDHRAVDFDIATSLYPHQQRAVDKLSALLVGALFMEMGTGKTRAAIELAWLRRHRISSIVWFCPVSLKETIAYEIDKHTTTPEEEIYTFDDQTDIAGTPPAFWYIVGLESISSSDRVTLTANALIDEHTMVVVDESSYIKGHDSLRARRVTEMARRARYRLILTGTPLSQGVVDLYAQMRFLSPDVLGYRSFYSFAANHLEYSEKYPDKIIRSHNTRWLAEKIEPYVYQITKEDAGLDLPAKLYDRRYYNLTDEQQRLYEHAKITILLSVPDEEIDSYTIFKLFNALQQIVSGFWRIETGELIEIEHHRVDALINAIASLPESEKTIVWCKYRHSVQEIAARLTTEHGSDTVALYYGDLNEHERSDELTRFRADARFLIATMATGGHGLDLTCAAYSIFYENEFKYANRIQAEDRIHRIGQTRRPTYIDLYARCGIEQRIESALARKENVVKAFRREVDKLKAKEAARKL